MRKSGILMHLASLPSEYGVGTMGAAARKFADFLSDAGQQYWQLLPICPTSYGDSPYQSFSTFAGNPYFIDLDLLAAEGLLDKKEYVSVNWGDDVSRIDYGRLYEQRYPVLNWPQNVFWKMNRKILRHFASCRLSGWKIMRCL